MSSKSIFSSKTVWAAIATFWIALVPTLDTIVDQNRFPNPREWLNMIGIVITTAATIYGRYSADATVYTPQGLPGRNKPDVSIEVDPSQPPPSA